MVPTHSSRASQASPIPRGPHVPSWGSRRGSGRAWHYNTPKSARGSARDIMLPLDSRPRDSSPRRAEGRLIKQFSQGVIDPKLRDVELRITNCTYAASYSLHDQSPYVISVPSQPRAWKPPKLPCTVPHDEGFYLLDHDGARFPNHPLQPAVQAIFTLNPSFNSSGINIVACASSLGQIFRYIRSADLSFRLDVEMVGNTLFIVRNLKDKVQPGVNGYGHSFLDTFTSEDPEWPETKSHQRIVSYTLANMKLAVRFECDGFLTHDRDGRLHPLTKANFKLDKTIPTGSYPLKKYGNIVPQDSLIEIKTRSAQEKISYSDHLPRLWLRQIHNFVNAYHLKGEFGDVEIFDVRQALTEWEATNQKDIRLFISILSQIRAKVKELHPMKVELCRKGTGPLQLRKRTGERRKALSDAWEHRWATGCPDQQGRNPSFSKDKDDGRNITVEEGYPRRTCSPSPEWICDESYRSDADAFSADFTACDIECGYCGRCPY
ncbi:hypothetical protein F5Y16DRAFT_256011 [Xylariaceae sp. FL0255]|nr:hypothetical protein F5Y16DRAFT_256011 [Xylariaceae sp. FL0255]